MKADKTVEDSQFGTIHLVRHRRARRVKVRVKPDATVWITLPRRLAYRHALRFMEECRDWIARQLEDFNTTAEQHARIVDTKGEIGRAESANLLKTRLAELAHAHGFSYGRVTVRSQQARWGSCSSANNISLNKALVYLPKPLIDYVLLHELVHTEHKDHSARFWRRLAQVCENAEEKRVQLRAYYPALLNGRI